MHSLGGRLPGLGRVLGLRRYRRDPITGRFLPAIPKMPDSTPPPRPRTIDPTRVMELRPALSISLNRSRVYSFVSEVLSAAKQEGAYGIVLAGLVAGHAAQDILVLGFPDPSVVNTEGLAPPDDIPLLVRKDSVGPMSGSANWGREPVRFHDLLGLKALSLGVEGNTTEAGSFGGFLKATSEDQGEDQGTAFGLTAAHCLPEATAGSAVLPLYPGGHHPL